MTRVNETSNPTPAQPGLEALLARYLEQQTDAHTLGLAAADTSGEVLPFEAAPVHPVDSRLAWEEAVAAVRYLSPGVETRSWQPPPHWANLVASHEPAVALPFCLGNFPQLVRNLHLLLHTPPLAEIPPETIRPVAVPALLEWKEEVSQKKQFPQLLLALAALRLAKHFDLAAELLARHDRDVPEAWRAAWDNESAALAWQRGQTDEALAAWQKQPESVPVLFNRGMASLFLNRPKEARAALSKAITQLPESGAWHHLAHLYLALAEPRR
jgi:tetratricopeptide (TPR) repeat protein